MTSKSYHQTEFFADEDLHGRNALLLTFFLLRELLRYLRESFCRSMNLYHIFHLPRNSQCDVIIIAKS